MFKRMGCIIYNYLALFSSKIFTAIWFKVLRFKLHNKDFSLITPNCIGGIIYHRLGVEFKSPTINLLFPDKKQYLRFVLNLPQYLSEELKFTDNNSVGGCPVAFLGDVEIRFVHYNSAEEAAKKWNERKKRVNYDNLFIIMDDVKDINYDDIKKFGSIKCKGKVLFTAKEYPEFDYVLPLSHYKGKQRVGSYMLEKNPFTQTFPFDHDFDYIKWLNTGNFLKGNHRKV